MTSITILLGVLGVLSSCSRDTPIVQDYKLYDLDGSNQVIIGNAGMVSVLDVTGYDVGWGAIIFETDPLGSDQENGQRGKSRTCRYGYIDLERNVVIAAKPGSNLSELISNRLSTSRKGAVVSRSCLTSA